MNKDSITSKFTTIYYLLLIKLVWHMLLKF